jgi:hypothetical protein
VVGFCNVVMNDRMAYNRDSIFSAEHSELARFQALTAVTMLSFVLQIYSRAEHKLLSSSLWILSILLCKREGHICYDVGLLQCYRKSAIATERRGWWVAGGCWTENRCQVPGLPPDGAPLDRPSASVLSQRWPISHCYIYLLSLPCNVHFCDLKH